MSTTDLNAVNNNKVTVPMVRARKGGTPLVALTAYSKPMAQMLDPHVDILLVGDSLGMVVYGFDSTLPVTLEMMIDHGAAVVRGTQKALVVVDMPFGTYQRSTAQAYDNAARVMQETGCAAVKLEGAGPMVQTVDFLANRGIPVMAHIGLQPQSVNSVGGYRAQGREQKDAYELMDAARQLTNAGAFSMVLEAMMEPLAAKITQEISIPTIGIGASPACDGQILVSDDLLGLFPSFKPRFVKQYADLGAQIKEAVATYAAEVRQHQFPSAQHCFGVQPLMTVPQLDGDVPNGKKRSPRKSA